MNPRKSARSNAVSEEEKLFHLTDEDTRDLDDSQKAELADTLEQMARLIRQNLHCMAGEPGQSTQFVKNQATPICQEEMWPRCLKCVRGKN
jgi:hypothetical protein